jgi:Domain of unknown function (DUF6438)
VYAKRHWQSCNSQGHSPLRAKRRIGRLFTVLAVCAPVGALGGNSPSDTVSSVVMHRSGCYGPCPSYTLRVSPSGNVEFDGEMHVKNPGHHTGHISSQDFAFMVEAIERIDFFDLRSAYVFEKDGCPQHWTDNPTVDIVVTRDGKAKRVTYYFGCRGLSIGKRISWLASTIDEVAHSAQWVGDDVTL